MPNSKTKTGRALKPKGDGGDAVRRPATNAGLQNPAERAAFLALHQNAAGKRVHAAVSKLLRKGVIDGQGRRVRMELPADMRGDSVCTLPG